MEGASGLVFSITLDADMVVVDYRISLVLSPILPDRPDVETACWDSITTTPSTWIVMLGYGLSD